MQAKAVETNVISGAEQRPESETLKQARQDLLLARINVDLAELGFSTRWLKLPHVSAEAAAHLDGKRILLVDNSKNIVAALHPLLMVASGGEAKVIWHQASIGWARLVEQVVAAKPDIVLLDYQLDGEIRGDKVVAPIKAALPESLIVGFSSEEEYNEKLKAAGADAIVKKITYAPEESLDELAAVVRSHLELLRQTLCRLGLPPDEAAEFHPNDLQLRGGLRFIESPEGRFKCLELQGIEAQFNQQSGGAAVAQAVETLAGGFELMREAPEFDGREYSKEAASELGRERFQKLVAARLHPDESPFRNFLMLVSDWWYYHPELSGTVERDLHKISAGVTELLTDMLAFVPEEVHRTLADYKALNAAAVKDHFVLLFGSETDTRCLVTDQQLIKLLDVRGYWYLDISGDGRPFARCVTSRGGGRAFFDGERLMAHPSFQTCAPKVSFFAGGYLVNSTRCSIVNGMLYPLINEADNVARTTGACCGMVDFSLSDAIASFKENDELGAMLKIDREGTIHTPKRSIRPIGVFAPSKVVLDNDGFSVYEWSEFHEL